MSTAGKFSPQPLSSALESAASQASSADTQTATNYLSQVKPSTYNYLSLWVKQKQP